MLVIRLFVTDSRTFFVTRSVPASPEAMPSCIPVIKPPICNKLHEDIRIIVINERKKLKNKAKNNNNNNNNNNE